MTAKRHQRLYDRIGGEYDRTRRADPYIVERLADHLNLEDGRRYLDMGCGTGNYTVALASRGGTWCGLDESRAMIEQASQKAGVHWVQSDARQLPFQGQAFAGVICTQSVHHFRGIERAFLEARRVLRHGAFVMFTAVREQLQGYWLNEYFPQALRTAALVLPSMKELEVALAESSFTISDIELYDIKPDLEDLFLYCGKLSPEMYLLDSIRDGTSTFAAIAQPAEVEEGCEKLRTDIGSGRIHRIIDRYRNDHGDYAFVIAR